jgi:hypothetical protein
VTGSDFSKIAMLCHQTRLEKEHILTKRKEKKMPLIATEPEGQSFPPIENGTHHAICYSVIDLGTQYSEFYGKESHKVLITWELPDVRIDIERDDGIVNLPRAASKIYTLSLHEKASLYKDLISWRGKSFTAEELVGFDIFKILGANCLLQTVQQEKNNKTYSNITAVTSLMKGMKKREPENEIVQYSMRDNGLDIPDNIPDWVKDLIKKSAEYRMIQGNQGNQRLQDAHDSYNESIEDDIPF